MTTFRNDNRVKIIRGINKGVIGIVTNHRVNGIEVFNVMIHETGELIAFNEKTDLFSTRDVEQVYATDVNADVIGHAALLPSDLLR